MNGKTEQLSILNLKSPYPQQIIPYKKSLMITHCDLTQGEGKDITVFHLKTGQTKLKHFSHDVIQCEIKNDNIYILSNDSIYHYKFNGKDFIKQSEKEILIKKKSGSHYYISGFFIK